MIGAITSTLGKMFPKVAAYFGGAQAVGAGYEFVRSWRDNKEVSDFMSTIPDEIKDASAYAYLSQNSMDTDTWNKTFKERNNILSFEPITESKTNIIKDDLRRDLEAQDAAEKAYGTGSREYIGTGQKIYGKINGIMKGLVVPTPDETKPHNIFEYAKQAQYWGLDQGTAEDYFMQELKVNKDPAKKELFKKNFGQVWGQVASVNNWRQKWLMDMSGWLAAGGIAAMVIPGAQFLAPVLGYTSAAMFGVGSLWKAKDFYQTDSMAAMQSIGWAAGGFSMFFKSRDVATKGTKTASYISENLRKDYSTAHDVAHFNNDISLDGLEGVAQKAIAQTITRSKSLYASFFDYKDILGKFNNILEGALMNKKKAHDVARVVNQDGVSKVIYDVNRDNYKMAAKRYMAGDKTLTDAERLAVEFTDNVIANKMAGDVVRTVKSHGDASSELSAVLEFTRHEKQTNNLQAFIDSEKMPIDIIKMSTDKGHFYEVLEQAKAKGIDVDGIRMNVTGKSKNGPVDLTFNYEYPYTPFGRDKTIIWGKNTESGEMHVKAVSSYNALSEIKEMKERLAGTGKFEILGVSEANGNRTNVKTIISSAMGYSEGQAEQLADAIMARGPEALREFENKIISRTQNLTNSDITKTLKTTKPTLQQLADDEEMQKRILNSSIYGSYMGPHNKALNQVNLMIGKLRPEQKNGTLAGMMQTAIESMFNPMAYKFGDFYQAIRSTWVMGNTSLLLGNHFQSLFMGKLNAIKTFGKEAGEDWMQAYKMSFSKEAYGEYAANVKKTIGEIPFQKNGFETMRSFFYGLEPTQALESQTIKNFLKIGREKKGGPVDYSKVFGLENAGEELTMRVGRDNLQFMNILQKPFIEITHPVIMDNMTSFYRYMVRPAVTAFRSLQKGGKNDVMAAVGAMSMWGMMFGSKATPLGLMFTVSPLLTETISSVVGSDIKGVDEMIMGVAQSLKEGMPDELAIPAILGTSDFMVTNVAKDMIDFMARHVATGGGSVGAALEKTGAGKPSFATLGTSIDAPGGGVPVEMMKAIYQNMLNLANQKKQMESGQVADAKLGMIAISQALADTIGMVKRLYPYVEYASGYGVNVKSPEKNVMNFFFPEGKYSYSKTQQMPVGFSTVDKMDKMVNEPRKSTEYFWKAFQKDPKAYEFLSYNGDKMVSSINSKLESYKKEGAPRYEQKKETLMKTVCLYSAWRAVGDGKEPSEVFGKLNSYLQKHNVKDTTEYMKLYSNAIEDSIFYKNLWKVDKGETL